MKLNENEKLTIISLLRNRIFDEEDKVSMDMDYVDKLNDLLDKFESE